MHGGNKMVQARGYGNIVLLILFVILPLTYSLPYADYILIATIFIISLPTLYLMAINRNIIERNIKKVLLAFGLYVIWLILMLLNSNFVTSAFVRIVQMLGCIFAFVCGSLIKYDDQQMNFIRRTIQLIILVNSIDWFLSGMPLLKYSFIVSNTATYGSLLFCWIIFLSIAKKKKLIDWVILLAGVLLLFFSSTRASLAAIALFAVLSFGMNLHSKRKGHNKAFLNTVLIISIIGCGILIFLYAESGYSELGIRLNEMSIRYFGKNLYSGRQIIWHELIEAINEKPLFGYGLNTLPSDIYDTPLSAHNTFLQVALQSGIVGLFLLVNILLNISRNALNNSDSWFATISVASIIAIIFHECFEACLVQNMLVTGLQMWFVMGMCTNQSIVKGQVNNNERFDRKSGLSYPR